MSKPEKKTTQEIEEEGRLKALREHEKECAESGAALIEAIGGDKLAEAVGGEFINLKNEYGIALKINDCVAFNVVRALNNEDDTINLLLVKQVGSTYKKTLSEHNVNAADVSGIIISSIVDANAKAEKDDVEEITPLKTHIERITKYLSEEAQLSIEEAEECVTHALTALSHTESTDDAVIASLVAAVNELVELDDDSAAEKTAEALIGHFKESHDEFLKYIEDQKELKDT